MPERQQISDTESVISDDVSNWVFKSILTISEINRAYINLLLIFFLFLKNISYL